MRIIELAAHDATLQIAPELGGAIASFVVRGRPMLRPTPDAALDERDVRRTACYPLVPYSNRIRNAKLRFAGRDFVLARNFGTHPHAIHGVGWQRPWPKRRASMHDSFFVMSRMAMTRRRGRGRFMRRRPFISPRLPGLTALC
jgi:galactose mutarotase-like enzyme